MTGPWQNGVVESLDGRVRHEYLNGERFLDITEHRQVFAGAAKYKGWPAPHLRAA